MFRCVLHPLQQEPPEIALRFSLSLPATSLKLDLSCQYVGGLLATLPPSNRNELLLSCRCSTVASDARSGPQREAEWLPGMTRKLK